MQQRAQLDAAAVVSRQNDDQGNRNDFDGHFRESEIPLQSGGQGNCHRGDGTRAAQQPACEAEHIAHNGVIRLIQINHHAAGRRVARAQLCEAQAAQDGHHAADYPAQQGQSHAHVGPLQNIGPQVEDARAYHDTGNNADAAKEAHFPFQANLLASVFVFHNSSPLKTQNVDCSRVSPFVVYNKQKSCHAGKAENSPPQDGVPVFSWNSFPVIIRLYLVLSHYLCYNPVKIFQVS